MNYQTPGSHPYWVVYAMEIPNRIPCSAAGQTAHAAMSAGWHGLRPFITSV